MPREAQLGACRIMACAIMHSLASHSLEKLNKHEKWDIRAQQSSFTNLLVEAHAITGSLHLSGCLIRSDLSVLETHLFCNAIIGQY